MGKSESNASSQTKRRLLHLHHSQTGRRIQVNSHSQRSLSSLDGWMKIIHKDLHRHYQHFHRYHHHIFHNTAIHGAQYVHWASSELVTQVGHEVQADLSQRIHAHQVRLRELQKLTTTHFR